MLGYRVNRVLFCNILFRSLSKKPKKFEKKRARKPLIVESSYVDNRKFGPNFFAVPSTELAKSLLGQTLVRRLDCNNILRCRIVETEAYLGTGDMGAHTWNMACPTKKTKSTFMKPGTVGVSSVYGIHLVLSISSLETGASVLLRSAEPISGAEEMRRQRAFYFQKIYSNPVLRNKSIRLHRLCSGPARLVAALGISSGFDGEDLTMSNELWIEEGPERVVKSQIVECPRVGLSSLAGEWFYKPLRYYILGHTSVSQRHKVYEKELLISTGIISEDGQTYLK